MRCGRLVGGWEGRVEGVGAGTYGFAAGKEIGSRSTDDVLDDLGEESSHKDTAKVSVKYLV